MATLVPQRKVMDSSQFFLQYWESQDYIQVELAQPSLPAGKISSAVHRGFLQLDRHGGLPFSLKGYVAALRSGSDVEVGVFIPVKPDQAKEKMLLVAQMTRTCMRAMALAQSRRDTLPELVGTSRNSMEIRMENNCLADFVVQTRTYDELDMYVYATVLREPLWSNCWVG